MLGLLTAEQPGYGEEEGPGCGQHGAYEQQTGGYDQQQSVHDQQQVGGYDHYMQQQPGGSKVVMIFVSNQEDMVISHHSFLSSCLISQLSLTQLK